MRNFTTAGFLAVAVSAWVVGPAQAATVVFAATDDTYIQADNNYAFFQQSNYGASTQLRLTSFGSQLPLIRFNTAGIENVTAANIQSVTLTFTIASGSLTDASLFLAQITDANSNWAQGTGTGAGNSNPGATIDLRNRGTLNESWAGTAGSAGGTNAATSGLFYDYYDANAHQGNAAAVYNLGTVSTSGSTLSLTLPNSVVTNWIANPTAALAGLSLVNRANSSVVFNSTEAAGAEPQITVVYEPVPEPTVLSIGGMAMLGILARRRRNA